ncbi:MAG TPA: SUF system Fe-S cluster assembly protein [Abditibacteriaceae bacterium]|jgi:FeS assembly SUF system protein
MAEIPTPDLLQLSPSPYAKRAEQEAQAAAAATSDTSGAPLTQEELKAKVIEKLESIYDPEIPVNIYELGLIYDIAFSPENDVHIKMTLTSPACPVAGSLPGEVELKVQSVPGVRNATIELVWDPPYHMDMMSEEARLTLGLM